MTDHRGIEAGRCRSCGARAKLQIDGDGAPVGVAWQHGDDCERTEAEERRLRSLAALRGADPLGMQWTPSAGE